jgi:hypothetical protein
LEKITRGLPRVRKFADDRAPTIEEFHRLVEKRLLRSKNRGYCLTPMASFLRVVELVPRFIRITVITITREGFLNSRELKVVLLHIP